MAYNGKTNWQLNEIVKPEDMNRIEQGVIDAHKNLLTHKTDTNSHTDIRNKFNEFVKGVTGSNATLTITKGNGTTSTVTVNNVANATNATNANKLSSESGSNYLEINTTNDSWSAIGPNPGNWLKSIRTNGNAPEYSLGNYSAAIAFGGVDTKGIITHAYIGPVVKFAGGNGSTAVWKFAIYGGYNNETYDLNNFPTKTGGGASGTWGINISGNANNATKWNGLINDLTTENNTDTWIPVLKDNKLQHTTKANMTVGKANTAGTADTSKACSGNAATATKLQTARTINIQDSSATNTGTGASFDGSGNATIKLPATIKANITGNCSGTATNITQRKSASAVTHADYSNNQAYVPDMSFMAFWNGAYNSGGNSNLTYSANGTIIGSKNIGSQTVAKANKLTDYAIPDAENISTSATVYIFLGTWSGTSDSQALVLDIYTGEGWNAHANQNDHINLFVKDSWQGTASATSAFGGVAHRYSPVGRNANNFAVALYATTANSVNVYLVVGADIHSAGFYTVSMHGGAWTHKGTGSTSAPGGTKQECINYDIMLTQKDSSGNIIIS